MSVADMTVWDPEVLVESGLVVMVWAGRQTATQQHGLTAKSQFANKRAKLHEHRNVEKQNINSGTKRDFQSEQTLGREGLLASK